MSNIYKTLSACVLVSLALLAGCAKKPPGCADAQVTDLIRQITIDEVTKIAQSTDVGRIIVQEDAGGFAAKFFASIKVEMQNVVQDGYSEDARRFSCRGNLTVTSLGETKHSRDIVFSSQATADNSGDFIVQVDSPPFGQPLMMELASFVYGKRTNGSWTGEYACEAFEGSDNPLAGPFTLPVTMEVKDGMGKLERSTTAGGSETLTGRVRLDNITLKGGGRNTPDDTWNTVFWGDIKGSVWQAKGEIKTPEGRLLRRCMLTLNLPNNS
jgi:hypothetical protein